MPSCPGSAFPKCCLLASIEMITDMGRATQTNTGGNHRSKMTTMRAGGCDYGFKHDIEEKGTASWPAGVGPLGGGGQRERLALEFQQLLTKVRKATHWACMGGCLHRFVGACIDSIYPPSYPHDTHDQSKQIRRQEGAGQGRRASLAPAAAAAFSAFPTEPLDSPPPPQPRMRPPPLPQPIAAAAAAAAAVPVSLRRSSSRSSALEQQEGQGDGGRYLAHLQSRLESLEAQAAEERGRRLALEAQVRVEGAARCLFGSGCVL